MGLEILQHLRGSAEENDALVGFDGEFTVDKTNKAIRVHDGSTSGGSIVVSEESKRVSNISELRNLHPSEFRAVIVEGYNSPLDGGGGVFYWNSNGSSSNEDNGIRISSNVSGFQGGDPNEGIWTRLVSGRTLQIEWWGPGSGDATSELQAAFDTIVGGYDLVINRSLNVSSRVTLSQNNVRILGGGSLEVNNNSNYDQILDITGDNIKWEINIDQSGADSHSGAGRGARISGSNIFLEDAVFVGENSVNARPNIYVISNGKVSINSSGFLDATSSSIEYNGNGTLKINDVEHDGADNTVSFLDIQSSITPGDIKVEGLEIIEGRDLVAENISDSLKIQRNKDQPRIFNGNTNPTDLGLSVRYERGDQIIKNSPTSVDNFGWLCVSSGSPGIWREFGKTTTEVSGNVLFDGDGDKTTFEINHGMDGTPSIWNITPTTKDGSVYSHITADPNSLIVKYDYAPPSGTNNIGFNWTADRNSLGMVDPNKTFLTENSNQATFSGNSSKTRFEIPHGFSGTPLVWDVTAVTDDASDIKKVEADSRYIVVFYNSAPPTGNQNIILNWTADAGFFSDGSKDDGGRANFTGDGSKQVFDINHNLGNSPVYWTVEIGSVDSNYDYYITSDSSKLSINFENSLTNGEVLRVLYAASTDDFSDINNEEGGEAVFSGDGSSKTYNIPHGLSSTPSVWNVTPTSSDSKSLSYVEANSNDLVVNFDSAPSNGTNNIKLTWVAKI